MWFTPTEYQLVLKSIGILGTGNSPSNKINMVTRQSMFRIVSLQYSCLCCCVQIRLCIPSLSSKQSRYDTVNARVCSGTKRACNETIVMFPIHTVYTLLRKLVEEFPEQNPIDSGTVLQTIQKIYRLLSIYITTCYCYCKVCSHEQSLEGLRFFGSNYDIPPRGMGVPFLWIQYDMKKRKFVSDFVISKIIPLIYTNIYWYSTYLIISINIIPTDIFRYHS